MAGNTRTVDVYLIYTDEIKRTWLHVIDLKYGKGVTVSAETNRHVQAYCNLLREKHPNVRHFADDRTTSCWRWPTANGR